MPFYVKKPIKIEAIQLTENSIREIEEFITGMSVVTETYISQDKWYEYCQMIKEQGGRKIRTLESHDADLLASFGDFIIKGVQGEFYPCKPDIFEQSYTLFQPEEKEDFKDWLLKVKKILVYINIMDVSGHLSEQDWKVYYDDDRSPHYAVKEDLSEGNIEMPKIIWSDVANINCSL